MKVKDAHRNGTNNGYIDDRKSYFLIEAGIFRKRTYTATMTPVDPLAAYYGNAVALNGHLTVSGKDFAVIPVTRDGETVYRVTTKGNTKIVAHSELPGYVIKVMHGVEHAIEKFEKE